MKHIGLFEGIGGFSLAARWAGWETIAWCEWNEFGQKVLRHHFPEATGHGDITKTDFTIYANKIDVLTGGFPCQPYSTAGKRLGKDDERHLWPEMLRAIREIAPRWVVGENVRGLVNWNGGMVFDEVQADLEACGYEVLPFILPACAKDAPHRRDRVWFVAHAKGNRNRGGLHGMESANGSEWKPKERGQNNNEHWNDGTVGITADTKCTGLEHGDKTRNISSKKTKTSRQRSESANDFETNGNGKRNASDTNGIGLRRESNRFREPGFANEKSKGSHWQNFPTQPPICSGDDGLPRKLDSITFSKWRNESIKAYGNAIVPQVAYEIFKAINEYEPI
jgi:DNA (cytosine-5)-methyltransferase 1